jgi:hypothetical protein
LLKYHYRHEQLLWTLWMVVFARRHTSKRHSYAFTCYFCKFASEFWENRKGSDEPIPVRINAPFLCRAVPTADTKAPTLSQNALYKMQELHSIEFSQFPNTRSCYASLTRSLKAQFKPCQLCHFLSLSSSSMYIQMGKTLAN